MTTPELPIAFFSCQNLIFFMLTMKHSIVSNFSQRNQKSCNSIATPKIGVQHLFLWFGEDAGTGALKTHPNHILRKSGSRSNSEGSQVDVSAEITSHDDFATGTKFFPARIIHSSSFFCSLATRPTGHF